MKIRKEVKIGAVAVLSLVLFVWGYNFLKGKNFFSREYKVYAHYQNSGGIAPSDPVILNGFKIGQVDNIRFAEEKNGDLIVTLLITNNFPIPKNSVAKIVNTNITGSKGVNILLGDASEYLTDGDTVKAVLDASMIDALAQELMPLKEKVETMIEHLDTTIISINTILNEQSQKNLIASIENLRTITQTFANQKNNIGVIIDNAKTFTDDLKQSGKKLDRTIDDVSNITSDLAAADLSGIIKQLQHTIGAIDSVFYNIQNGNGTLSQLINNDSLYNELNHSAEQLHLLLEDIQKNPKKYVKFSVF